jgi:hypothetical protein
LPADTVLGDLTITTVTEGAYVREDVVGLFEDLDLDPSFIPPTSTAIDAFNKATRRKDLQYEMPNGSIGFIQVDQVTSPNPAEMVGRMLTRREMVRSKSILDFSKVGEIHLYRGPRRSGPTRRVDDTGARLLISLASNDPELKISPAEKHTITQFAYGIQQDYERYFSTLDGNAMRKLFRCYQRRRLAATKIKDSLYFIPVQFSGELARLKEAADNISGCTLDLVPLVDMVAQRDHVIRTFQAETEETMRALVVELQEARSKGRVSVTILSRLRQQFDDLMGRVDTYTDALGEASIRPSSTADVVKAALAALSSDFINTNRKDHEWL